MIVSNVSLGGCAGVNSALSAGAGEGHLVGGSYGTTLTPTGNLVVAVCLGFIGTFGLTSNLLVLVLFCRYKMLRSPINLLLINISISDLLVCVLGTPFSFAASTQGRWLIGDGGCVWYGFANSLFGEWIRGMCAVLGCMLMLMIVADGAPSLWILLRAPRSFDSDNIRYICGVWEENGHSAALSGVLANFYKKPENLVINGSKNKKTASA